MPTKAWHKDALDAYVNNGGFIPAEDGDGVRLACSTETEIGIYEAGNAETEAFGQLKKIACPVVIAKGTSVAPDGRSPIYSAVIAPSLAAAIPAGALIEFPNNSHLGPMEAPREVASSASELFTDASSPSKFPSKL